MELNSFLNRRHLFQILFEFFFTRISQRLMGKRSIELYVRAQAMPLYQLGLNLLKISKQLQVSRCCVCNAITKFEEYTKFDDLLDQKVFLITIYVNSKSWFKVIIDSECSKNNNRLKHQSIQADVQAYGASIFEEAWLRV